ncbi:MAG: hypothetical protein WC565_04595 [Parcubacteria group bacterium]
MTEPTTPEVTTEATESPTTAAAQPVEGDGETFDRAYVQQLRKEAATYRTRLKALEDVQKEQEQAKLGDLEKVTKRYEEATKQIEQLQATLKSERVKWAVAQAAQRLNLDGELAASLVKLDDIQYDPETGQPENPEKHLKALLGKWPQLVKPTAPPPSINADAGRGSAPSATANRDDDIKRRFRIS